MKSNTLPVCKIKNWDLNNKIVFLRADLNVPLKNGTILDDFRLRAILPTLDLLLSKNAHIILATHLGRPQGFDATLSTKPLAAWFNAQGYPTEFVASMPDSSENIKPAHITLLENLRFNREEKKQDAQFAQMLANGADYYVNDAWAVMHRTDTSITVMPQLFRADKKSIGLLVEKELAALSKIKDAPKHPFVAIIGGGKVADKLPVIEALITTVDILVLEPAIVFTFLKALGKPVGKSLVDDNLLGYAQKILDLAQEHKVTCIFPLDYVVAQDSFYGTLSYCNAENFPETGVGISMGPKTITLLEKTVSHAKTIFVNGLMGDITRPETLIETKKLFELIAHAPAYTVIGGGDSVAAIDMFDLKNNINYCSTGGGATLAYISNAPMPGLDSILQ